MCGQRMDAKTDVCIIERSPTTSVRYFYCLCKRFRSVNLTFACRRLADMQHDPSATCPWKIQNNTGSLLQRDQQSPPCCWIADAPVKNICEYYYCRNRANFLQDTSGRRTPYVPCDFTVSTPPHHCPKVLSPRSKPCKAE